MANHETRRGSWGTIPPGKRQPDGRYKANGRYKTLDGKLLQRFRTGTTARKAEDALLAAFQTMAAEDANKHAAELDRASGRDQESEVLFAEVIENWISYIEAGGKGLRVSTAYEYARMARADIVPSLGALKLTDLDIKTCADFLHGIVGAGRYYAKAEHNRAVLSNILEWCAGRGLIPGNPVRQVAYLPKPRKKPVQIIEKEDMAKVLSSVRHHGEAQMEAKRPGPPQNLDIPDGVELLLATGVRISELLALRWDDVWIDELDDGSYWVQITFLQDPHSCPSNGRTLPKVYR